MTEPGTSGELRLDRRMNEHTDAELEESPLLEEILGDALPQMRLFHVKLSQEGEERGLIGPRDVNIIWERHILNSAAVVPFIKAELQQKRFKSVADLGSGGGFPGIVAAACLPDCSFTLIEPMERRVTWLRECVQELNLNNVDVLRSRSEQVIQEVQHRHSMHPFDVVTCRAVAPMTKLAGWTLPLLCSGGRLIALKGKSAPAEIKKAHQQIKAFGGVDPQVRQAEVGPGLEPTNLVLIRKR
jgi:16S rRNA (guanine527-N7)-methyltransferase